MHNNYTCAIVTLSVGFAACCVGCVQSAAEEVLLRQLMEEKKKREVQKCSGYSQCPRSNYCLVSPLMPPSYLPHASLPHASLLPPSCLPPSPSFLLVMVVVVLPLGDGGGGTVAAFVHLS